MKEEQIYNPRYGAGAEIIQNLRSNKLRRSAASYSPIYSGVFTPQEDYKEEHPTMYDSEGDVVSEYG